VLEETSEQIKVTFLETSAAVVGLDKPSRKGFDGSRVGMAKVVSDDDVQLLESLIKLKSKHPLKNWADLLIIYTAIKENMDFLVTANRDDFEKPLELFKKEKSTRLELRSNRDIVDFL
jgi:hypothetical protein